MPERSSSRTLAKTIVLITIDALRADHVSCYAYRRLTTPFLDRLAGEQEGEPAGCLRAGR